MATSTKILLTTEEKPAFFVAPLRKDSAEKVSELLQENHEKHHAYFNNDGFHNHIAHHLLTLYALGATPTALTHAYTSNATYQRPPLPPHTPSPPTDLSSPERFAAHLGDERFYPDYLAYFSHELSTHGLAATLATHLFARTPRADDLLVRTHAGFLHPLIHLGFGIEFGQPAIVAEALAQAATHDAWIGEFLLGAEGVAAAERERQGQGGEGEASLRELLDEIRGTEKVRGAARWEDRNKLRDGVIARAGREMCAIAGKWVVKDDDDDDDDDDDAELERKTAEMVDAAVFFSTTAQHPPNVHKVDFFYMHCVNSSVFFSAFLKHRDVFPRGALRRLLEWKGRVDLALYASRGAPELRGPELAGYVSARREEGRGWEGLFEQVNAMGEDDGHASKYVRAVANGAEVCGKGGEGLVVGGEREWWLAAAMGLDGVEAGGPKWVRSCGFEEAWRDVPLREEGGRAQL